jgi:hypothetical protein
MEGPPPETFLVSLAALSLLSPVAEERPLLCLVDDAQWLDRQSVSVLSFVARRLRAEPIAMLFAVREPKGEHELDGLAELALKGLGDSDASLLLDMAVPGGHPSSKLFGKHFLSKCWPGRVGHGRGPDGPEVGEKRGAGPHRAGGTSGMTRSWACPVCRCRVVGTVRGGPNRRPVTPRRQTRCG